MTAQQKMPSQTKSFQTFKCSENGLILLLKTPGTIRFTTRKKVMLEPIYKHSEVGKSPEVPTAHEVEHGGKCI